MELLEKIREYKNSSLKNEYINYISDTSIDLSKRWEIFLEAPVEWKNKNNYIIHFDTYEKLNREVSLYDDFFIERYNTAILSDMVERIEDDEKFLQHGWTKEVIDMFKEEILEKNMYSFINDW